MEYLAFRQLIAELPDIAQVLMDPEGAPVPENPSARYLVSMALAAQMTNENFGVALRYLQRLPTMFRAFSVRDAMHSEAERHKLGRLKKAHRPIIASPDFAAWACSDEGKDIVSAAS
jgi:hypothetical protein